LSEAAPSKDASSDQAPGSVGLNEMQWSVVRRFLAAVAPANVSRHRRLS